MAKLISVIVPCYQVEKYVGRCIDSIINQTIGIENIELILVDDASKDGTKDILHEYEAKYPDDILVIECQENGRQGRARNIGLVYATGQYIAFVDSDDWIEPCMYEHMYELAVKYNTDVTFCRHTRDSEYLFNNEVRLRERKDMYFEINDEEERKKFLVSDIIGVGVWDKLYRREMIYDNNIRFPEGIAYEDICFGAMIYLYASKIYILEENLYHYFINWNSTVLTMNQKYVDDLKTTNLLKLEQYRERIDFEEYMDEIEFDFLCTYYLAAVKMLCLRFEEFPVERFRKLKEEVNDLFPDISKNKYIGTKLPEIHKITVEMLSANVSDEEIKEFGKLYKKLAKY